jgi:hypothetical protein
MDTNFVQIGDENYINLMNVARVRFADSCAEVFYTGGLSESITDPDAVENLRRSIGAPSVCTPIQRDEPRKGMELAQPTSAPLRAENRR